MQAAHYAVYFRVQNYSKKMVQRNELTYNYSMSYKN